MEDGAVEGPAEEMRTFEVAEERANERNRGDTNGEVCLYAGVAVSIITKDKELTPKLTGPRCPM